MKGVGSLPGEMGTDSSISGGMLDLLGVPEVETAPNTIRVVATVMAPREPNKAMERRIGRQLAERARAVLRQQGERRAPAAVIVEAMDHSDSAICEGADGQRNAFLEGERCYRAILSFIPGRN
jgi:hypothetical protein